MVRVAPFFDSQCILASGHQSALGVTGFPACNTMHAGMSEYLEYS